MPAQQLFNRLSERYTDDPWRRLIQPGRADWPAGVGVAIADPRAMVVHETTGWPARERGQGMFEEAFLTGPNHPHDGVTTQFFVSGDGTVMLGMEPPGKSFHANFTNDWAFGGETGHAAGNYKGNAHLGPGTESDPTRGDPIPFKMLPGNKWLPLSGNDDMGDPAHEDLSGIKMWARHVGFNEVVIAWWTTARYAGPWREPQRVPEMLFNDAQYRAWALLARFMAERWLLPRNIPLLPHKTRIPGTGVNPGQHGMLTDAASFASIVLADEAVSRSPAIFGLHDAPVPPTAAQLQAQYPAGLNAAHKVNRYWRSFFEGGPAGQDGRRPNSYRGFHAHGFSGDPGRLGDHDCPGPMFDWHRFARELWDWWWHPFDFNPATPNAAVAARPYSPGSWDGNTPLKEHYWGTDVTIPAGRKVEGLHGPTGSPSTFELPAGSRIYAMASGELVAARFPAETGAVNLAFMVVRHQVFHQLDGRPAAPAPPRGLPTFAGRIDYDVAPTTVYALYMHLGRPAGMRFDQVDPGNPDWLNRMLARYRECQLGATFRQSPLGKGIPKGKGVPKAKWDNRPPGSIRRPTVDEAWTTDLNDYSTALQKLASGDIMLASHDLMGTPIRIVLGDWLSDAGVVRRDASGTKHGVRVEIFSRELISTTDWSMTVTDAGRRFDPLMDPDDRPMAVRYPSEWSQEPEVVEGARLTGLGVDIDDLDQIAWWDTVQAETAGNPRIPSDGRLDGGGMAVHYDPYDFLPWINQRTWRSEWPKYRAVHDPANPAAIPDHPIPRS